MPVTDAYLPQSGFRHDETIDCLVIGGGPAGLTAATYLARFRRRVTVVHTGESRAQWIPLIRNFPGFPEGISGPDLLARQREQAGRYGARILEARVTELRRDGDGFTAASSEGTIKSRTVLLATGVADKEPPLPDVPSRVASGHIRFCPVCDGYEVIGRKVGVLGSSMHSVNEARFLLDYTPHVSLIAIDGRIPEEVRTRCLGANLSVINDASEIATLEQGYRVGRKNGDNAFFDVLYPALGCDVRSGLGRPFGMEVDDNGQVVTDAHQRSSVDGIYAAGDVVQALNQIAVACGQAAMAATDIHNRLSHELGAPA